jgi:putative hemolysin
MKELPNPTFPLTGAGADRGLLHRPDADPQNVVPTQERGGIEVAWAKHQDEVREAQRLRFDVFAKEMGARLSSPVVGHDIDLFDDFCEHLLVRDVKTRQVIGTYRVNASSG